jgi:DNA polymerase elongation subunit (family B)
LQKKYKILCNSVYGQMGSRFSVISCIEAAVSTTCIGRQAIEAAKQFAEQNFVQLLQEKEQ